LNVCAVAGRLQLLPTQRRPEPASLHAQMCASTHPKMPDLKTTSTSFPEQTLLSPGMRLACGRGLVKHVTKPGMTKNYGVQLTQPLECETCAPAHPRMPDNGTPAPPFSEQTFLSPGMRLACGRGLVQHANKPGLTNDGVQISQPWILLNMCPHTSQNAR